MSRRHICRSLTPPGDGVVAGWRSLSSDGSCCPWWRGAREGESATVPQEDVCHGRWLLEVAQCPTAGQRHLQVRDANIVCVWPGLTHADHYSLDSCPAECSPQQMFHFLLLQEAALWGKMKLNICEISVFSGNQWAPSWDLRQSVGLGLNNLLVIPLLALRPDSGVSFWLKQLWKRKRSSLSLLVGSHTSSQH